MPDRDNTDKAANIPLVRHILFFTVITINDIPMNEVIRMENAPNPCIEYEDIWPVLRMLPAITAE